MTKPQYYTLLRTVLLHFAVRQLVRVLQQYRTLMGSNPVQAWFFRVLNCTCSKEIQRSVALFKNSPVLILAEFYNCLTYTAIYQ